MIAGSPGQVRKIGLDLVHQQQRPHILHMHEKHLITALL